MFARLAHAQMPQMEQRNVQRAAAGVAEGYCCAVFRVAAAGRSPTCQGGPAPFLLHALPVNDKVDALMTLRSCCHISPLLRMPPNPFTLVVGNISHAPAGHRVRGIHGIAGSGAPDHRLPRLCSSPL